MTFYDMVKTIYAHFLVPALENFTAKFYHV